jgi:uncharacterized membrane protein YGL010W
MDAFQAHMRLYREQHRTVGCKITHMFGVPMIVASLPTVLFAWPAAAGLFVGGWALQFMGHYVFEHNDPLFFAKPTDPYTYLSAVVFVAEEWTKVLSGKPLREAVK